MGRSEWVKENPWKIHFQMDEQREFEMDDIWNRGTK